VTGVQTCALPIFPLEVEFVDGRRWEVMYLLDEQVDEFLARVDPEPYEGGAGDLAVPEYSFLERLTYAEPLIGAQWLARRRGQVEASALRSMVTADRLDSLDNQTEDATGMLKAGDLESAVLAARNAFGHAVDALLAAHGEVGHGPKWRARRLRLTQPEALSFETYWALETMRSFDPDRPGDWVVEVLEACQDIALEIDL